MIPADNFDDLDSLLDESTRTVTAATVRDLDDLDQLLNESLSLAKDEIAGKSYRDMLKKGGMTKEEKAEIEAKLLQWESRREWLTQANVALIRQTTCSCCGGVKVAFAGLYYRQKHRTSRDLTRLVAAKHSLADEVLLHSTATANEVLREEAVTAFCMDCLETQGFDLGTVKPAVWA